MTRVNLEEDPFDSKWDASCSHCERPTTGFDVGGDVACDVHRGPIRFTADEWRIVRLALDYYAASYYGYGKNRATNEAAFAAVALLRRTYREEKRR